MSSRSNGTVAWRMPNGKALCVDCDCWPPDGEDFRVNDVAKSTEECAECGARLYEVRPLEPVIDYGDEA